MLTEELESIKLKVLGMNVFQLHELQREVSGALLLMGAAPAPTEKHDFKVGETVEFHSSKHGRKVSVIVTRVNPKTLSGIERGHPSGKEIKWRVSPGMCVRTSPETKATWPHDKKPEPKIPRPASVLGVREPRFAPAIPEGIVADEDEAEKKTPPKKDAPMPEGSGVW